MAAIAATDGCRRRTVRLSSNSYPDSKYLSPHDASTTSEPSWTVIGSSSDSICKTSRCQRFNLTPGYTSTSIYPRANYVKYCRISNVLGGRRRDMEVLIGISGTLFIIAATATKFIPDSKRTDPAKQLSQLLTSVSPQNYSGSRYTTAMDSFYTQILLSAVPDDFF